MITCKHHKPAPGKPCLYYVNSDIETCAGFCTLPEMYHCTESLKSKLPCISHTTASNLAHCNMAAYYSAICGINLKDEHLPNAVRMGKAWDAFLDDYASGCVKESYTANLYEDSAAKVTAAIEAFKELGIKLERDGETQPERFVILSNGILTTHADRVYPTYLVESKFTGRPESYLTISNISHQVGSYLLAHPGCERVIMEVTQVPQQKLGAREELGAYADRVYADILLRPGHYFKGYNATALTFGKVFYRSEFNLDDIKRSYERQLDEFRWRVDHNAWYEHPARIHCDSPTPCWFKSICETGRVSSELYEIRHKEHKRNG